MSRIRLSLLSLLAAFAVSAIASASASAEACHRANGTELSFCIENVEINSPGEGTELAETFTSKSGVSELAVTGLGTIVCKKDKNAGELVVAGDSQNVSISDLSVTFEECSVTGAANCEVPNIVADGNGDNLDGTFLNAGGGKWLNSEGQVSFSPSNEGGIFAKIIIKNKGTKICLVAGNYNVTGSAKCKVIMPETEKVTHTIECLATESELFVGGKAAKFTSKDEITLSGMGDTEDPWSIKEDVAG